VRVGTFHGGVPAGRRFGDRFRDFGGRSWLCFRCSHDGVLGKSWSQHFSFTLKDELRGMPDLLAEINAHQTISISRIHFSTSLQMRRTKFIDKRVSYNLGERKDPLRPQQIRRLSMWPFFSVVIPPSFIIPISVGVEQRNRQIQLGSIESRF